MCSRITKNRKNVCYSMMTDYRRRAFISQMRAFHPEHFPERSANQRYSQIFVDNPDYLAPEFRCKLQEKHVVHPDISVEEESMLFAFLEDIDGFDDIEDYNVVDELELTSYSRMKLNGVKITIMDSEDRKGTCDSIVCGRYAIGEEHDGSPVEKFYFGQVKHIAVVREVILLCVQWFKTGDLSYDQHQGLKIIPVSLMDQDQMWITATHVLNQQHILLRPSKSSKDFHVMIKI
jgi:hypothetical protein